MYCVCYYVNNVVNRMLKSIPGVTFVMYSINVVPRSSLLIESVDSMIITYVECIYIKV